MTAADPRLAIAQERLANQRLVGAPLPDAVAVVRWLGAMQAQEYAVARWSIGRRSTGLTESDIDRALADGSIVRTHVMRDTWHFVAADDLHWIMELTRPRIQARNALQNRRLELDQELLARTDALLRKVVASRALTRPEIGVELGKHGVEASGPRLAYILAHAELGLVVCSGGLRGKQQTYALVDERVPIAQRIDRDDALARLALRYFTSHGPATVRDFSWWASLTLTDCRRGVELAGRELERREIGDRTYWSAADNVARSTAYTPNAGHIAHLLQGYDEYIISYSESRDVLDIERLATVLPIGVRLPFLHGIFMNGQGIGRWRRASRGEPLVEMQLARSLSPAEQQALGDAIADYERFCGSLAAAR